MTSVQNVIYAGSIGTQSLVDTGTIEVLMHSLRKNGYCLVRGFDGNLADFSQLTKKMCKTVTFDPARDVSHDRIQKVDAGSKAIGLHIENGNTPLIPQLVSFLCKTAAPYGAQTTLCDGVSVLANMDKSLKTKFKQTMTVSRTLPERLWKTYLANEHPAISCVADVTTTHLTELLRTIPGHSGKLLHDNSLLYSVKVKPLLTSTLGHKYAFANAILGPSTNYEPPRYQFADGSVLDEKCKALIQDIAELFTVEISWQSGDIAVLDNHRIMHGRRAIPANSHRELYIGMGNF